MTLPINKIIQGDCIEELKKLPDNSVDTVITDPPYKISKEGGKIVQNLKHYKWKRRSDIGLDFGEWDRNWKDDEEFFLWIEMWFKECIRILKPKGWIYIFFDKQKVGYFDLFLSKKYGVKARTIFTWVKTNPVPSFRKVNWNSGTEFIWVGSKGDGKIKNFLKQKEMNNYFLSPNASAYKKTKHPTEKPEILIERFILSNTNEEDIVLDCFGGSGTTAVSCLKLNRKFILIERERESIVILLKNELNLFLNKQN